MIMLITIILVLIGIVVFFKFFYTAIPQNSALIVNNQKVHFTNAMVMPTDKKQFMLIEPVHIKTAYTNSQGVLCKEKLLLNIVISYSLCVDFTPEAVLLAANKIGVANVADPAAVAKGLAEPLLNNVKNLIAQYSYDVLDKDRGKVRKALFQQLTNQLDGYKVEYINIEQVELVSMDMLAQQNETLFKQQQQARYEWDMEQKKLLERRLTLITEHQRDLSNKVKAMIESYQRVIRQKIKFFINRELLK